MTKFPEDRLEEAGATPEELDKIRSEYNLSDVTIQRSLEDHWKGLSNSDLRSWVTARREVAEPEIEEPEIEEPELKESKTKNSGFIHFEDSDKG
jgi:hypothetical protein